MIAQKVCASLSASDESMSLASAQLGHALAGAQQQLEAQLAGGLALAASAVQGQNGENPLAALATVQQEQVQSRLGRLNRRRARFFRRGQPPPGNEAAPGKPPLQ